MDGHTGPLIQYRCQMLGHGEAVRQARKRIAARTVGLDAFGRKLVHALAIEVSQRVDAADHENGQQPRQCDLIQTAL